ncbi:MAG: hypothetical protein ACM3N0_05410 [Chloroflexota bacterium]
MGAIWRQEGEEWQRLSPAGFPSEEKLHDLVEREPSLLPLSGSPSLVVLGREVALGAGFADLVAVEPDGRVAVLEIKLSRNSDARRAVIGQILTYAAYLKGLSIPAFEEILRPHLARAEVGSVLELVRSSEQSPEVDGVEFSDGLAESLASGAFRLVLVLDEAPSELVQLVGYLESIASGVVIDLVTVAAYEAGDEQLLVPQRVDPEHPDEQVAALTPAAVRRTAKSRREVDGSDAFEAAVNRAPETDRPELMRLLKWARELEGERIATLRTVFGSERQILKVWVPGKTAGLVSIWNENGAYLSLWRSVFVRLAWDRIAPVEEIVGEPIGQGSTVRNPSDALLAALADAYRDAAKVQPAWNERDFYVSFGENDQRSWDEAVELGFISAGGGEWYTRSLQQLEPGHRIFAYIPKGNGVGGYVGVGEVTEKALLAKDFVVSQDGREVPYLEVTKSPEASQHLDEPALAEWVVPVKWIATRLQPDAVKDSDFFANQNSAVKMTHGYTLKRLTEEFGVDPQPVVSA